MKKRIWIDTHNHISDIDCGNRHRPSFTTDLDRMVESSDADLRIVASVDPDGVVGHHWFETLLADPEGVIQANTFINKIVQHNRRRYMGACMVNPRFLDASLRTMEDCFERWGFVLLGEILQYLLKFDLAAPDTRKVVARGFEYGVPAQVHVSTSNMNNGGIKNLEDLCDLAEAVPDGQYIIAHAVGTPADPPVFDTYLKIIDRRYGRWPDNFWIEIRDFNTPGVFSALRHVPINRIVSGTDWTTRTGPPFSPFGTVFGIEDPKDNPYPPSVEAMVGFLRAAGADETAIERIAFRNAMELLKLDKGTL